MNNLIINPSKMMFLLIMMMGTIMSISSYSWPAMWMGLEINMLSFIPLMITNSTHLPSAESSMKYFLIQAMASSMFILFIILIYLNMNYLIYINLYYQIMISTTLLIKMGAAPFHFWFPTVMEGLSWNNCLLLMTWQKIAPMIMLSLTQLNESLIYLSIITSVLIGSIGGLNQTSNRKIMAYSSINHIGWMLMAMMSSNLLWIIYFSIYAVISSTMILFFKKTSTFHLNQISFYIKFNSNMKLLFMMTMLSLGGLPPMMGFIPKWMIIQTSTSQPLIIFMVLISLITLFFYARLMMSTLMMNNSSLKWMYTNNKIKLTMLTPMMLISSILGFIIYPSSYILL